MDCPQISRSGRVLKKSAKVKEMEDFDINELDAQGKPRKKSKTMDEFDEFDDKRVAPIKIPKISLNMQSGSKKRMGDMPSSSIGKQIFKPPFQNTMKANLDPRSAIYRDSSDVSNESDSSSSASSETSTSSSSPSSSEASDAEESNFNAAYKQKKVSNALQSLSFHQDKVIVEQHQQRYESPIYMGPTSDQSSEDSEDVSSDAQLVIAEDFDDGNFPSKGQKGGAKKRIVIKKEPTFAPKQGGIGGVKKKPPPKLAGTAASKKKKPAATVTGTSPPKAKPLTAYMIFCSENRKKIAASSGNIGFGNIGKKMGEAWQALPEKEKMAWRRKAKRLALKSAGNVIKTGSPNVQSKASNRTAAVGEEGFKGLTDNTVLGTAPIDAAAHLKLLGDSLTVIGQRLIEHEGQLAVSGIYSVLLDTLLCAVGPLLCLTTEIPGLEPYLDKNVFKKTLDHIAYFMPGL